MGEDKSKPMMGFYRAKVVDSDDPTECGRVKVWIVDTMPKIDDKDGLWACPANNPVGGNNAGGDALHHYQGTTYIPAKGSWIWIFFENGRTDRPYYFSALDIGNSKTLPENRVGGNKFEKWVIFKSHYGRTIVISDDPDDCRVEITGKKRLLAEPPSGDTASVYTIDANQTTILLSEKDGKEKLLIKTHKGDFINIDVETRKLQIKFENDIVLESGGSIYLKSAQSINLKAETTVNAEATLNVNIKAGANLSSSGGGIVNIKGGGAVNIDGSGVNEMTGAATEATSAGTSPLVPPIGDR